MGPARVLVRLPAHETESGRSGPGGSREGLTASDLAGGPRARPLPHHPVVDLEAPGCGRHLTGEGLRL